MASVFWLKSKGVYVVRWKDLQGKRRQRAATTDKRVAQRIAAKIEADLALRRDGVIDPYLEAAAASEQAEIEGHLLEFAAGLEARGATDEHVRKTLVSCRQAFEACGVRRAADLDAGKIAAYLAELARPTEAKKGLGARARNARLGAVKQFGRWLYRTGRTRTDRTAALTRANVQADRRRRRRALSDEEIGALLATTEILPPAHGMAGPLRALLYRTALGTGLRAAELASLTVRSLDFAARPPTATIEAGYSKHRRRDVLPLARDLADRLAAAFGRRLSDEPLFPLAKKRQSEMLLADLRAAGIEPANERGETVDFHALRHTFISRLARSGASPAVARALARHSTISLTMDHYAHLERADLAAALERMEKAKAAKGKHHA